MDTPNSCAMKEISLTIFGTEDYEDILDIMAPSDILVKEFWKMCVSNGLCDASATLVET